MSDQNQPPSDQSDPWAQFPAVTWNDFPETPRTLAQQHAARVEGFRPAAEANLQRQERSVFGIPQIPETELPLVTPLLRRASAGTQALLGEVGERLNLTEPQNFNDRYANILAREEANRNAYRAAHPNLSRVGDVFGVLGGVAALPSTGAANLVMRGASRLPAFLEPITRRVAPLVGAAAEGAIQGAPTAMVEALPGESLADVGRRGLAGAQEGAIWGAGAHAGLSTALGGAGAVRNFFRSPEDRAVRRLQEAASNIPGKPNTGLMATQEFEEAARAGRPVSAAYVAGMQPEVRQAIGRLPESEQAEALRTNIFQQHSQRIPETRSAIDDIVLRRPGQTIDAATLRQQSLLTARNANRPLYDAAYSAPQARHIWNPWLEDFVNTTEGKNAIREAVEGLSYRQMGRSGRPIDNPFDFSGDRITLRPGATVPLEIWDRAKRALDDTVNNLQKNPIGTRPTAAADIGAMRDELRNLLTTTTRAPNSNISLYENALNGAGRYKRADNAFDDGFAFFNAANAARETRNYQDLGAQLQNFRRRFSPDERVQFRLGLASFIRENPDQAARVFAGNEQQTMRLYREVLGNRFDDVRNQMLVHNAQQAIQGISGKTPALPHTAQQYAIGAVGLLSALVHGAISPVTATGQFAAHGAAWLANSRSQNTARAILELASDPARHVELMERLRTNPEFREILQRLQPLLVRSISQQAAANAEAPDERPTRASGGRITSHHRAKAQALINAADRAKKAHNGTTKPILDMPDETVAKALSLADQAI